MLLLRKKFLIDKTFQIRFMRFVIISCVLVCSISLVSQYFFIEWLLRVLRDSKVLPLGLVLDFVSVSDQLLQFTLILILGSVAIIVSLALFYSHRIAGPIYNMKKTVDSFLEGKEDTRVHLRQSDYLVDLADKINLLLDKKKS